MKSQGHPVAIQQDAQIKDGFGMSPWSYWQLVQTQKSNVRLANSCSDWFAVLRGVRQGCNLSPCLFNIMVEVLMHTALDGFKDGF